MKKLKIALLSCIFFTTTQINSQNTEIINLNTGVYGGNTINGNGLIPVGTVDDTWTVMFPNGSTYQSTYSSYDVLWNAGANANFSCGMWISPEPVNYNGQGQGCTTCSNITPEGTYKYRMSFTPQSSCMVKSAKIVFRWTQADNELLKFSVNNSFTYNYPVTGYQQIPNFANASWYSGTNYIVNLSPNDIILGSTNTIDFYVRNYNSGSQWTVTGFALCAYLEIEYYAGVTATISAPTVLCQNQVISVIGNATGASNYQWQIQESDNLGNPINQPAHNWLSDIYSGEPENFDFPTLDFIQCGKYYVVTLIASTNNDCLSKVKTVIYIQCGPPLALMSSTVCYGKCGAVSVINPNANYNYMMWDDINDAPLNTTNYTDCPLLFLGVFYYPTVYASVTDPITGCSSTASASIYVDVANPNFNLYVNNSSPNYMQLSATPIQITNLPSSYIAWWMVEELDASGNSVYTINGSSCWSNFPNIITETFSGFQGLTQTINTNCIPVNGQFKYNTTYRITRRMSAACGKYASSIIVNVSYVNPNRIYISQEVTDNSFTADVEEKSLNSNLKIYPNPNNGVFTIHSSIVPDNFKVIIRDVLNRVVKTLSINQNEFLVNLDTQENGIYFVSLYNQDKLIKTEKIILQK